MLSTPENILFPGYNHLLTTGVDDPIIKVSGHQYQWLAGDYDLEIGHFQGWIAWWMLFFFLRCVMTR